MTDMKKYTVYILEENKDLLNNIKESIIKTIILQLLVQVITQQIV